jgi:hypothetical protein
MRIIASSIGILTVLAIVIAITFLGISIMQASALICTHPDASCSHEGTVGHGHEHGQNTITILKAQNKGSASGFDTNVNQEADN